MTPELASPARLHAVEMSGDEGVVEGPLHGYHHETYVFPLPGEMEGERSGRWKCREPRADLLWFDRRCFDSEENLLRALHGQILGIPDIIDVGGIGLQRFIEGDTLAYFHKSGTVIPDIYLRQIMDLFRQMVVIRPDFLRVDRRCKLDDRADDGDSEGFLERLVLFTEQRVFLANRERFDGLFGDLWLGEDSFRHLRKNVFGLARRPFCLLHADLHRENFIVDAESRLWTIDWELAMLGDPLYDLATHLHLMRYPARHERAVAQRWSEAVEGVRAGISSGWEDDLERLLNYKRAQSVFTDVIRTALELDAGSEPSWWQIAPAAFKLRKVLTVAAPSLGLDEVPGTRRIVTALMRWCREYGSTRSASLS
ncbi:MAG: aminoglycoside phosphotransferase family protein [Streptomyces sp.]|uniref:aminoglycoside phosphotransferase family protein n=1 Tax=Streptomyces sp. TaxID=1931 RepID=UPI0025EB2073|nr:aminoglycoside phosphotransferase family protein [Streptomyces sp.]MBW8798672.1 aminoglycoside phosphotransferase family protein [Streptomyces sp.]